MPATIYDVAKRAGVGIGTVSRALNDSPQILPHTKAKVLKAIEELDYQPHAMARGLARKKTNMIAVIVPFFTGYFFLELLRGVQQEVTSHDYDLLLYSLDHRKDKVEDFIEKTLQERRVDGVLLISLPISDYYASLFIQKKCPIVLVDSYHPKLDSITVKNREGAYLATKHLLSLGHEKVAMIDGQLVSSPAQVRLLGYKQALEENGIPFRDDYLAISDFVSGQDGFNREAGYHAMARLLELGEGRPTAVFVSSDIQAAGAMLAIQEAGLNVPDDIALIGFDDIELAEYLELSTMRQPMFEMGKLGVERLIDRIDNKKAGDYKISFSTQLISRKSCGPPCASKQNNTHETVSA